MKRKRRRRRRNCTSQQHAEGVSEVRTELNESSEKIETGSDPKFFLSTQFVSDLKHKKGTYEGTLMKKVQEG